MIRAVKELDFFRKIPDENKENLRAPSAVARCLWITATCLIGVLVMKEVSTYLTPLPRQSFALDYSDVLDEVGHKKLRVMFNITIHNIPCMDLSLDYQDVMGTRAVDVKSTVFKRRLKNGTEVGVMRNDPKSVAKAGNPSSPTTKKLRQANDTDATCGSCYGALPDNECCNTCSDVLYAYRIKRWALPRIEEVLQCRNDGTAKSQYQPPQIMKVSEFSFDDYYPKFTKVGNWSKSVKSATKFSTPLSLNFSFDTPLYSYETGSKDYWSPSSKDKGKDYPTASLWDQQSSQSLPLILNFSTLGSYKRPSFSLFDDEYDPPEKPPPTEWSGCVKRNTLIHGVDAGEALMEDLTKFGAKEGCWEGDCTETDKFDCKNMSHCAFVCNQVTACKWWTWGDEHGKYRCWLRTGKHSREKRWSYSSGKHDCYPGNKNVSSSLLMAPPGGAPGNFTVAPPAPSAGGAGEVSTIRKDPSVTARTSVPKEGNNISGVSTVSPTGSGGDLEAVAANSTGNSTQAGEGVTNRSTFAAAGVGGSSKAVNANIAAELPPVPRRLLDWDDSGWGGRGSYPISFSSSGYMSMFEDSYSKESKKRKEQRGESCEMHGHFDTNKVPGNFHIGTHGSSGPSYLNYLDDYGSSSYSNMEHTVNRLAFVEPSTNATLEERQPIDDFRSPKAFTFQYYLTITPATLIKDPSQGDGAGIVDGFKFKAGSFVTNELIGPAVFFRFDIDPIRVTYSTEWVQFERFLIDLCAIVGGCVGIICMLTAVLENVISLATPLC